MSTDNEKLYVVTKHPNPEYYNCGRPLKTWTFRTRQAARDYAERMGDRAKNFYYVVSASTWGPEQ